MKRTLKNYAFMVLVSLSMTVSAQDLASISDDEMSKSSMANSNLKSYKDVGTVNSDENQAVFKTKRDVVYFRLENRDLGKVSIEVRDGRNRIIYAENILEQPVILKSFNFKKAFEGYYVIKVDNDLGTFTEEIEIR